MQRWHTVCFCLEAYKSCDNKHCSWSLKLNIHTSCCVCSILIQDTSSHETCDFTLSVYSSWLVKARSHRKRFVTHSPHATDKGPICLMCQCTLTQRHVTPRFHCLKFNTAVLITVTLHRGRSRCGLNGSNASAFCCPLLTFRLPVPEC